MTRRRVIPAGGWFAVAILVVASGCSATYGADDSAGVPETAADPDAPIIDPDDRASSSDAPDGLGPPRQDDDEPATTTDGEDTQKGRSNNNDDADDRRGQGRGNQKADQGPNARGGQQQQAKKQRQRQQQQQQEQVPLPDPWPSNQVPIDPAPAVANGSSDVVQRRLLDLGFWHDGSALTVSQAITAFQKYHGLGRTGSLDQTTLDRMANQTVKPFGLADAGNIVEVDKARQIMFVLEGGRTKWVFNVSTGNGRWYETENQNNPGETLRVDAITRGGFHHFFHAWEDGWRDGDLGELYRPRYFDGGIAVHGYRNVPSEPASSGCVRVTVAAMDFIWEQEVMPMGMNVWVHGPDPEPRPRG